MVHIANTHITNTNPFRAIQVRTIDVTNTDTILAKNEKMNISNVYLQAIIRERNTIIDRTAIGIIPIQTLIIMTMYSLKRLEKGHRLKQSRSFVLTS